MRSTILIASLPIASLVWTACGGETAPTNDPAGDPQANEAPRPEAPPGPLVDDPTFELRATAAGPYAPGQEGRFEIRLTPKGRYHVNQEFPMGITLTGPSGVSLPPGELGREAAAQFGEQIARFDVPFTASAAGQHQVQARVSFAVCTPESCMPDERTLAFVLPVQ